MDKDELYNMSAELGMQLDEEQLNNALKDLDMNGDGVIDYDEFKRWYFSGMKSYSDRKRSFFQALNSYGQFSKHAANPDIMQFIKENNKTIKQKVSMSFNEPAEGKSVVNAAFWVGGDKYEKLMKKA
jgi:hypothetical protein